MYENKELMASFLIRAASPDPRGMNSAAAAQVEHQQHFTMPASKPRAPEILTEQVELEMINLWAAFTLNWQGSVEQTSAQIYSPGESKSLDGT